MEKIKSKNKNMPRNSKETGAVMSLHLSEPLQFCKAKVGSGNYFYYVFVLERKHGQAKKIIHLPKCHHMQYREEILSVSPN